MWTTNFEHKFGHTTITADDHNVLYKRDLSSGYTLFSVFFKSDWSITGILFSDWSITSILFSDW